MADSDFWQIPDSFANSLGWVRKEDETASRHAPEGTVRWMVSDILTVLSALTVAILMQSKANLATEVRGFLKGTLVAGSSIVLLLALVAGFGAALVVASRRLHLYSPIHRSGSLHEQRLSLQACVTADLILIAALYLIRPSDVSQRIFFMTMGLVAAALSLRRVVYRQIMYLRFARGVGTRNVLIVGHGPQAQALRHQMESTRSLGYAFKGFLQFPGFGPSAPSDSDSGNSSIEDIFRDARRKEINEIVVTTSYEHSFVQGVVQMAQRHGVTLRVVPDMYACLALDTSIEYIGEFLTIPLKAAGISKQSLLVKRGVDVLFSGLILILLAPLMLTIALAIKIDSSGPAIYWSPRVGKKGKAFKCAKFRTMVPDAEARRAEVMHMNERDRILFKVSNDPRITRVGHLLRKYSLDELPQFFNVLAGSMSVVGPRPPIVNEVREYNVDHLRRLDVKPGITGYWQVQGRRNPSFDSYLSMDLDYIQRWSGWLDFKIVVRTIGVVFSGTGT